MVYKPVIFELRGLQMVYKWFKNGLKMVYKWFTNGLQMVYKWFTNALQNELQMVYKSVY